MSAPSPQRFAARGDRGSGWYDVHVCAVRDDVFFGDGRRLFILEPVESHALADTDLIEQALVGHRAPAEGEIDRDERRLSIVAVNLAMQKAGVEGQMRERFKDKMAAGDCAVRGRSLFWFGGDQNARRVSDRPVEVEPGEDDGDNGNESGERFQQLLKSKGRAGVGNAGAKGRVSYVQSEEGRLRMKKRDAEVISGGCMCGAVRYEGRGEPYNVTHCHCIDCRRAGGAAFVTWASFARQAFRFVKGEPRVIAWAGRLRSFCEKGGTSLTFMSGPETDEIDVTVASFDEPERVSPSDHTWVSDRLSWIDSIGSLPVHERQRPLKS